LFLGNYVDRGRNSLELICSLLALKIKFPDQIFLLRGSHEDKRINFGEGLGIECENRIPEDITNPKSVFNKLNEVFEYFSYAAVLDNKIFCVHSGIGTTFKKLEEIERIKKPFTINPNDTSNRDQKLVLDLLWSDPVLDLNDYDNKVNEMREQQQNSGTVRFGINRINEFLASNSLQIIVRSHESVVDGAEEFGNTHLFTIFSCTDYAGTHGNDAAMFLYHKNTKQLNCLTIPYAKGATQWYEQTQPELSERKRKYANSVGIKSNLADPKERAVTPLRRMTKNS